MQHRNRLLVFSLLLALVLVTACVASPPAAPATSSGGESKIVSWYYFDQNNTDPQANERVGNFYLARAIPQFNEEFKGKRNGRTQLASTKNINLGSTMLE